MCTRFPRHVCQLLVNYFPDTLLKYMLKYVYVSGVRTTSKLLPHSRSLCLGISSIGLIRVAGQMTLRLCVCVFSDYPRNSRRRRVINSFFIAIATLNNLRANPMQFKRIDINWPKRRSIALRIILFDARSFPDVCD